MAKSKARGDEGDEHRKVGAEDEPQEERAKPKPAPPEYGPPLYKPRPELAAIVGPHELSRPAAARKVWAYIKRERLRHKNDPSMFETDDVLKQALEVGDDDLSTAALTARLRRVLQKDGEKGAR